MKNCAKILEDHLDKQLVDDINMEIYFSLKSEKYNRFSSLLCERENFIWGYAERTFDGVECDPRQRESLSRYKASLMIETPYDTEIETLKNNPEVIEILNQIEERRNNRKKL